jgi:hypothetical protein
MYSLAASIISNYVLLFYCISCGRNLLPYAPTVCKLVLQTLKWTSAEKWAYGIEKPYG